MGDLVPNHTSVEHAWFREALAAGPGSEARDRYHFRPGQGENADEPPNNWASTFGGPAWTRTDDGEWYLHLFDSSQPDLNWAHPDVRPEFLDILRFWFDLGLDGFRVDVAHSLAKDPTLPNIDLEAPDQLRPGGHPHWDRDDVHDLIREWRALADSYPGDRLLVAEALGGRGPAGVLPGPGPVPPVLQLRLSHGSVEGRCAARRHRPIPAGCGMTRAPPPPGSWPTMMWSDR